MGNAMQFPVSGQVAAGFEAVRKAFETNFTQRGDVGAALHVLIDGETVVDLWGGSADAARTKPWTADTLVNVWSTTKGWLALAMHLLAQQGLLDFEAPVAHYWPEFAQNGKGDVLIKHLLTHTAGLPGPSMKVPDEAVYDWDRMIHSLEQSTLFWKPGTQCGYHAATFGWLNGEVLRRITGMSVGTFLQTQIADSLGADAFIGLSPQQEARAAEIIPPPLPQRIISQLGFALGGKLRAAAFRNPPRPLKAANTSRWRRAEIPSSNGHTSARGLARIYAPLAFAKTGSRTPLLSEASVECASREQVYAKDIIAGTWVKRSLGFMLSDREHGDPLPPAAFGHPGMGGSMGFADPQRRLSMGYVMNQMIFVSDSRWAELCRAVYDCLDKA